MIAKNKFSLFALVCILWFKYSEIKEAARWEDENQIISSDARGYYAYLPAFFIYDNIKLTDLDTPNLESLKSNIWYNVDDEGRKFIKYSCGTALLELPFFTLAHWYALNSDYPADGFSPPYRKAISYAALFYLFLGGIFITLWLRNWYSDGVVSIVLVSIFIGTNIYYYYTANPGYAHASTFVCIAAFLFFSTKYIDTFSTKWAVGMSLSFGLVLLVRPVDVFFGLYPILYGVNNGNQMKQRLIDLFKNKLHVPLIVCLSSLTLSPQLIYNYVIFGNPFHYGYQDEGFFFSNPQIFNALFSYRNGWLLYTPIMIIAISGCLLSIKYAKDHRLWLLIVFPIFIYVISSWWCWWYVGFGNRGFISLYPMMALGLAIVFDRVRKLDVVYHIAAAIPLSLLVYFNQFQVFQFNNWMLHYDGMTKEAYWDTFLRDKMSPRFESLLRTPVYERALKGEYVHYEPILEERFSYSINFNEPLDSLVELTNPLRVVPSNSSYLTNSEYDCKLNIVIPDFNDVNARIRADFVIEFIGEGKFAWISQAMDMAQFYRGSEVLMKKNDGVNQLIINCIIPPQLQNDQIQLFLWNMERSDIEVKNIDLKLYRETFEIR